MDMGKTGAVIVAAGRSERMQGIDKSLAIIDGRPLLDRLLDVFHHCQRIDELVLVLGQENLESGRSMAAKGAYTKPVRCCTGGSRRQDSVRAGLEQLGGCRWAVIHDGARPLVSRDLVDRGILEAYQYGAAVAAVPVKDTVKRSTAEGLVAETPSRDDLWLVQTPQVFRFDLIWEAHVKVTEDVSDDASMVEKLGHPVKLYPGNYANIKITTPEDLALAAVILSGQ